VVQCSMPLRRLLALAYGPNRCGFAAPPHAVRVRCPSAVIFFLRCPVGCYDIVMIIPAFWACSI